MGSLRWPDPSELADALVSGARRELDLTPKPGLVDRCDNGSHPDLTYERMTRSIDLLPIYFEELLARDDPGSLDAAIRIGRAAEARMLAAIGANAHKGYIFLCGVVLLAVCGGARSVAEARGAGNAKDEAEPRPRYGPRSVAELRVAIATTARRFFERVHPESERGGIRAETIAGLPCVFEIGLPAYEQRLRATGDSTIAAFDLMAHLMIHLDDTTAARRCGPEGPAVLRADGATLLAMLDAGDDPRAFLAGVNDDYRRMNLTMGGVADCMALSFALDSTLRGVNGSSFWGAES